MDLMLMSSAVVPSLLLLWYFYSRDAYPEPIWLVLATFALGVATIPVVLAFAKIVDQLAPVLPDPATQPYAASLLDAWLYAALPEETLKLAALLLLVWPRSAFDEPMDGLVYGVAASLGFATLENVLYVDAGGMQVALTRALTALPVHCTLGAIMGFYVARAKFSRTDRRRLLARAWLLPMLLHTLYDFPLFAGPAVVAAVGHQPLIGRGLNALLFGVLGFTVLWGVRLAAIERALQLGHMGRARPALGPKAGGLLVLGLGGVGACSGAMLVIAGASSTTEVGQGTAIVAGVLLLLTGGLVFWRAIVALNRLEAAAQTR